MFASVSIIYFVILLTFENTIDGRSVAIPIQADRTFISNSDLFGGDIILPPQLKNRALTTTRSDARWPNGIIPYAWKSRTCDSEGMNCIYADIPSHSPSEQEIVLSDMRIIEEATAIDGKPCIQFRPKISSDDKYISIFSGRSCSATLGYYSGSDNRVSLGPGCVHKGTVRHELMHTLGFSHEHQRPDRDQYIQINWENIDENDEVNFEIDHNMVVKQDTPYDYSSITHYAGWAFSNNDERTMESKPPGKLLGQPYNLSDIDILEIRTFYKCFDKVPLPGNSTDIQPNARWQQNGLTVAGGNREGNRTNQLFYPWGLYVDDDQTIYVADQGNHRIVEWKSGATSGQVIAGGNGRGNRAHQLSNPSDVIVDKERDSIIICDYANRRVVRWPRRNGKSGETIISNIDCMGLTMDKNGSLYVTDIGKKEVRRYRRGEYQGIVVAGGNGSGNRLDQLSYPTYVFVDRDHSVYVSDMANDRVMKWMEGAKQGIVVAGDQGYGNSLTQLYHPQGVVVDQLGNVYVADKGNDRIMRWVKGATQGNVIVGGNGLGEQSNQLYWPHDLSFDRHGNLYVVDYGNHRVQKFNIDSNK